MSRLIINPRTAQSTRRAWIGVRIAAAAVCVALVASAAPAGAATNSVTIGSVAQLTVKISVEVPVTIVCDPLADPGISSSVWVRVMQANGKQVSTGTGETYATPGSENMLICDGSTQNRVVVRVLPDEGSGPFKNGAAYVSANFLYSAGIDYGGGYYYPTDSVYGSTASDIKLR